MHGQGVQYFDDGSNYTGGFEHSQRQPFGTMRWPNGTIYKGGFSHNRMDKIGRLIFPNGDKRFGKHTMGRWHNGTRYTEGKSAHYIIIIDPAPVLSHILRK